jgi:hypothetical protein
MIYTIVLINLLGLLHQDVCVAECKSKSEGMVRGDRAILIRKQSEGYRSS